MSEKKCEFIMNACYLIAKYLMIGAVTFLATLGFLVFMKGM